MPFPQPHPGCDRRSETGFDKVVLFNAVMIAANNSYLLAFDNLSGLPHWLSDALCRLATFPLFARERPTA